MRFAGLIALLLLLPVAAQAQCSNTNLSACPSPPFNNVIALTINGATPGTVSSASVATANGFAGSVATATSTPVITIRTTVTGLLKGSGTAVSAASAGTDYLLPGGSGAALTGLTFGQLPALSANQLLGALTATTPSGQSVPSCSGSTNALIWTSGTGFGCNTLPPPLSGTTASIGGSALAAGACAGGTVSVSGATTAMDVHATPATYPGDGNYWLAYVSSANVVTVKVCGAIAGTPTASAYNVRVIQ